MVRNGVSMKTYFIAAVALLLIIVSLLWFVNTPKTKEEAQTLTPATRFDHAHGLALDPTDATQLYIATHDGLYVLQNNADLFRIGSSKNDLMGFSVHPTKSATFFASGHSSRGGNLGFQKSGDGGITWENVSAGLGGPVDFHALAVSSANPEVLYGSYAGKLQRSTNGGRTWTYSKGSVNPISLAPDHSREGTLYAATQDGVRVSEDYGDSWKSLSPQLENGAVSVIAYSPHDATVALAFAEAIGGLGRSVDGGLTWSKMSERFGDDAVLYIAFSRSEQGLVYAMTTRNALYQSVDDGVTWRTVR